MGNPKLGPTPSGTGAIAKMRLVRAPGHGQKCLVWSLGRAPGNESIQSNTIKYNQYINTVYLPPRAFNMLIFVIVVTKTDKMGQ